MILCPISGDWRVLHLDARCWVPSHVAFALGYKEWDDVQPADFIARWCAHVGAVFEGGVITLPRGYTFEDSGRGQSSTLYVGEPRDVDITHLAWCQLYREVDPWTPGFVSG